MGNNDTYTLIGSINLFDLIPNFVYPVFKKNGRWYFQDGSRNQIKEFVLIKESVYSRLIPLHGGQFVYSLKAGAKALYGFQSEPGLVIYGDSSYFREFFSTFNTDDVLLQKKIDSFLADISHLEDGNNIVTPVPPIPFVPDIKGLYHNKQSCAHVFLKQGGTGEITINGRTIEQHFKKEYPRSIISQLIENNTSLSNIDFYVTVRGGNAISQANVIRQGILKEVEKETRTSFPTGYSSRYKALARKKAIRIKKK